MANTQAEFIAVALAAVRSMVIEHTPALLAALAAPRAEFTNEGGVFRGQLMNPPMFWVQPVNTVFDPEGQTNGQDSQVQVIVGVTGGDPDELALAALDYVRVVTLALQLNEFEYPDERIKKVFVREQNYGALRSMGNAFAAFCEVFVVVRMEELG